MDFIEGWWRPWKRAGAEGMSSEKRWQIAATMLCQWWCLHETGTARRPTGEYGLQSFLEMYVLGECLEVYSMACCAWLHRIRQVLRTGYFALILVPVVVSKNTCSYSTFFSLRSAFNMTLLCTLKCLTSESSSAFCWDLWNVFRPHLHLLSYHVYTSWLLHSFPVGSSLARRVRPDNA